MSRDDEIDQSRYNVQDFENLRRYDGFDGIYPFISEFTFRSVADHIIDPNQTVFDPSAVEPGDIVYVGVWHLE